MKNFLNFAEQYDIEHLARVDDINFYLDQSKLFGNPILDIGCGTGRISIPLLQAGNKVTCFDKSQFMLDHLKKKLSENPKIKDSNVEIIQGNMLQLDLPNKYPLIICTFNTFLNLIENTDREEFLRRTKALMTSESRFILDLIVPNTAYLIDSSEYTLEKENIIDGKLVSRRFYRTLMHDSKKHVAQIEFKTVLYEENTPIDEWNFIYTTKYLPYEEVIGILKNAGFTIESSYGNYKGKRYMETEDPKNQIFVCKKI